MLKYSLVLCVSMFFFVACSSDEEVIASRPTPKKNVNEKAKSQTLRTPNRFEPKKDQYFFDPVDKRNPFKPYVQDIIQGEAIEKTPLEKYDLDQLSLTGIIWGISDPRALIKAPDGYSYVVRANSRIGKKRGRVSRITRTMVFVEEEFRDPTGKLMTKESTFKIRKSNSDDSETLDKGLDFSDE